MYQTLPQGPTPASPQMSSPDRTRILDPHDFWPSVRECPDWPNLSPSQRYDGPTGRAGAEQRLEAIGRYLNRAATSLHAPSPEERDNEFSRVFKRTGTPWFALGIMNLSPLGRLAEDDARMIVEACHIRGYLRKLEAASARDAEAAEQRKLAEARRTLEQYRATVPGEIEEIKSLAEAVARHQQRLEDERAVGRSRMLRDHVETLHSEAVRAAHTLGLGVPDAPEF